MTQALAARAVTRDVASTLSLVDLRGFKIQIFNSKGCIEWLQEARDSRRFNP